jgi:nicotinamidase-related amidase
MNETVPAIDPHHTMLLVMDYQPAILHNLPNADALLSRVGEAIDIARNGGMRIGYVRVGFDDADYDAIQDTDERFAKIKGNRHMYYEAPETTICDAIAPEPDDLCRTQNPCRSIFDHRFG